MENSETKYGFLKKAGYVIVAAAFCAVPWFWAPARDYAPGLAVVAGIIFSWLIGNPFRSVTGKLTSTLLGATIVGMGCGMNLLEVLQAGGSGFLYTVAGIVISISFGVFLGKRLGLPRDTMYLISIGTSICGGSAIAASAPVLKAKAHDVAIASAVVFTLNAVALLVFPAVGHALGFSQEQFGYWAALGIHDTSSVVGACFQYGEKALATGTTIKLARALWIVPVTLWLSCCIAEPPAEGEKRKFKLKIPWFIPGFLIAAALVTWIPALKEAGGFVKNLSKYVMIATLFMIGSNLDPAKVREMGLRPVIHGIILWITLATLWCLVLYYGLIG